MGSRSTRVPLTPSGADRSERQVTRGRGLRALGILGSAASQVRDGISHGSYTTLCALTDRAIGSGSDIAPPGGGSLVEAFGWR